ncbi:MAG: FtsB family cell division protein [Candidatus Binataceae bacterium]
MSRLMRLSHRLRREWLALILGGGLAAFAIVTVAGSQGPGDLLVLRRYRGQLEARRERLEQGNAKLGTIVQKLRSDDRYLERLIRRELGYARENELIYRFGDDPTGDPR